MRAIIRRLVAGAAALTILLGAAATAFSDPTPLEELEPRYRESVLRGWRSFQTSFARDGAACIDCHPRHAEMKDWAPTYPKAAVFDGTPYRVKGLAEVVGEALAIHTDLKPAERDGRIADLVSFIAWWGIGEAMGPGSSALSPERDRALLKAARQRGRELFEGAAGCIDCHASSQMKQAAARYPRYLAEADEVLPLTTFLRFHGRKVDTLFMGGGEITDLAAYLAELSEGRSYRPGGSHRKGTSE